MARADTDRPVSCAEFKLKRGDCLLRVEMVARQWPLLAEDAKSPRAALVCIDFFIINFNVMDACLPRRTTLHTPD